MDEFIYPPLVFYLLRSQSTISNIDVPLKFLPISDFSLPTLTNIHPAHLPQLSRQNHRQDRDGLESGLQAVLTDIRLFDNYENMKKERTIAALASLAQESRLDVFRMLVQSGPDGLAAGEIGARLGVPAPTLSFHLNHLKHAGLVTCRRDSRSIIYSADYNAMNELISYLMENCCRGDSEQCVPAVCKPARETNIKQRLRAAETGKREKVSV